MRNHQTWLLKSIAIELRLASLNRHRSHTQRLMKLLLEDIEVDQISGRINNIKFIFTSTIEDLVIVIYIYLLFIYNCYLFIFTSTIEDLVIVILQLQFTIMFIFILCSHANLWIRGE